jgi:hypothetical protein
MNAIKIVKGKRGYHLKVKGLYISHPFGGEIKAIRNEVGIPYGTTEWASLKDIRNFWHKYMQIIIHATNNPYRSVWGKLHLINK